MGNFATEPFIIPSLKSCLRNQLTSKLPGVTFRAQKSPELTIFRGFYNVL